MTPAIQQTLASGAPADSAKYGSFGVRGFREVGDPAKSVMMLVGQAGAGKTSFYLGHAGALILNFDGHSVPLASPTMPPPLCSFWPVVDNHGQYLDENMKPILLTWDRIEAKLDRLREAAKRNEPRPETIVFDSLAGTLALRRGAIAKTMGFKDFTAIDNARKRQKAYGDAYDSWAADLFELHQLGYGVAINAQLNVERVEDPQTNEVKIVVGHNLPDKLYMRISSQLEYFGTIEARMETVNSVGSDGKTRFGTGGKSLKRYLVNVADSLTHKESSRARVALPHRIELPDNPLEIWPMFVKAVRTAAGQS